MFDPKIWRIVESVFSEIESSGIFGEVWNSMSDGQREEFKNQIASAVDDEYFYT